LTGQYFMIGSAAFRVIEAGGFEPVPVGVPPGQFFLQRMQCSNQRVVDPANLFEIWYGGNCSENAAIGLISLDQTSVPVAVRPSVPTREVLLDRTRGRAIFTGFDRLVLVHYADPSAAGSDELIDLTAVVSPYTKPGTMCSGSIPCSGTDFCAGATDTAYTGQCSPNPRLPFLPFCGGFGHAVCDDDFTCSLVNPTNPNSVGGCIGYSNRDFLAHGPACSQALPCPNGMICGGANRCEPKICLWNEDCAAYPGEICGLVENLGRVCLAPGTLVDGAPCFGAKECSHGACVGIAGAAEMGDTEVLHGIRGLLACTTPCYRNADCPGGEQCISESPLMPDQNYGQTLPIWQFHHAQVMPYCRPANLPPLGGCEGCTSEELCVTGYQPQGPHCQLGFDPVVWVKKGIGTAHYCLPPTENCNDVGSCQNWGNGDFQCRFPCKRSGDCRVFPADCANGSCSAGSPCGRTCVSDESCGGFNQGNQLYEFCTASDSCRSDAGCGGGTGSCVLGACIGPLRTCNKGSECEALEECAEWWWNDGRPRHCLPALCGCTGPGAPDRVCNLTTDTCVSICVSGSDCNVGEECVGSEGNGYYCRPAKCGCIGPHAPDMACDEGSGDTCIIRTQCTDVPCNGTVISECNVTPPDPLPNNNCSCPGCAWENTCPVQVQIPVQLCPANFICVNHGQSLPQRVGSCCTCNSSACQTP
jgi:hypothetical protein